MGAAVATTLQTLGELVRDHGARLLGAAAAAGGDDGDSTTDGGSSVIGGDGAGHGAPPLVLLALRLAAPPSALRGGGGAAAASSAVAAYEVQHAAVDVLAAAVAHKVRMCIYPSVSFIGFFPVSLSAHLPFQKPQLPALRPLSGRVLSTLLTALADVRQQLQSGGDDTGSSGGGGAPQPASPSLLRRLLLSVLGALLALLADAGHGVRPSIRRCIHVLYPPHTPSHSYHHIHIRTHPSHSIGRGWTGSWTRAWRASWP